MRIKKVIDSFNYAIYGIIHSLKTQRNIRFHFITSVIVLGLGLFYNLSKVELILLFFAIASVIVAELFNTAIEAVVDLLTDRYHKLAETAKDVAAGAVLVTAINSMIVGYLIFFDRLNPLMHNLFNTVRQSPMNVTIICLLMVIIFVIAMKAWHGKGTPLRGGMPSGHSAIAFTISTSVSFLTGDAFITTLAFLLSLLVAQSRVESGIHSFFEVLTGAIVGTLAAIIFFQILS